MEVGGVERSLLSMLNNFDYQQFDVDLLLYSHSGDFLSLLPPEAKLLDEIKEYRTVRKSIKTIFTDNMWFIAGARLLAKLRTLVCQAQEKDYLQAQFIWRYCLPFFPKVSQEYDVAISYLWPHNFVADKVKAKLKIAWIHTDYSAITTNIQMDLSVWETFDYIVSISADCTQAFVNKYSSLQHKLILVENLTSPEFIKAQSLDKYDPKIFCRSHFNLLSVGRLCHAKGFDLAIQALSLIHQQGYTNIRWYVIGYGPDETQLKALIAQYKLEDSFILLGKINNPYPYMKSCDLYVQPSRYEGKAVTISEAKILAKAILVTNYPTAKSQIDHDIDGVICPSSTEAIAQHIIDLAENPAKISALSEYCQHQNYANNKELQTLYQVIKNT